MYKLLKKCCIYFLIMMNVLILFGCNENKHFGKNENLNLIIEMIKNKKTTKEHNNSTNIRDFDSIFFGRYEQDGNIENGLEDIEWIILDKNMENQTLLLTSKYALKSMDSFVFPSLIIDKDEYFERNGVDEETRDDYFYSEEYLSWDNCLVNKFIKEEFIKEAFDEYENNYIVSNSQIINGKEYKNEKILLLTKKQLEECFLNNFQRMLYGTTYCGISVYNEIVTDFDYLQDYLYIDDENKLSKLYSTDYDINSIPIGPYDNRVGFRPTIYIKFNDRIKEKKEEKNNIFLGKDNIEINHNVVDFLNKYNIVISDKNKMYEQVLYNTYIEFCEYINNYKEKQYDNENDWYFNDTLKIDFTSNPPNIKFSYLFIDINSDGIDELIILHRDIIFDIYIFYNGEVKNVLKKGRSYYIEDMCDTWIMLTSDNKILKEVSVNLDRDMDIMSLNNGILNIEKQYSKGYDGGMCVYCTDYKNNMQEKKLIDDFDDIDEIFNNYEKNKFLDSANIILIEKMN